MKKEIFTQVLDGPVYSFEPLIVHLCHCRIRMTLCHLPRSNGLNIYVELDSDEELAILVHSGDGNEYLENEMLTSSNLRIARSHPSYGSTIVVILQLS